MMNFLSESNFFRLSYRIKRTYQCHWSVWHLRCCGTCLRNCGTMPNHLLWQSGSIRLYQAPVCLRLYFVLSVHFRRHLLTGQDMRCLHLWYFHSYKIQDCHCCCSLMIAPLLLHLNLCFLSDSYHLSGKLSSNSLKNCICSPPIP